MFAWVYLNIVKPLSTDEARHLVKPFALEILWNSISQTYVHALARYRRITSNL